VKEMSSTARLAPNVFTRFSILIMAFEGRHYKGDRITSPPLTSRRYQT
jgi:hypothetical protein